ncbi:MAG: hypothetical protein C4326_07890 [Ignavibacteria bacterium]
MTVETSVSKLITIQQGHDDETKVRGFMCPLMIKGNPELIRLAYESGLGEKGSLGFGFIELANTCRSSSLLDHQ